MASEWFLWARKYVFRRKPHARTLYIDLVYCEYKWSYLRNGRWKVFKCSAIVTSITRTVPGNSQPEINKTSWTITAFAHLCDGRLAEGQTSKLHGFVHMCCIELIKKFGWRQQLVSVFTPLAVPLPLDLNDDAGFIGILMGKGSLFQTFVAATRNAARVLRGIDENLFAGAVNIIL